MTARIAWRILTHEKGRTLLATAGIFVAVLLVFVELGFFIAVPQGGMLVYDLLRFDLLLCSTTYVDQAQPGAFPRARLQQALALAQVATATPLYFAAATWVNGGARRNAFVIGFDPAAHVFAVPDIERQIGLAARPATILVDSSTRASFGPLDTGRAIELAGHTVTIGGRYRLGTGFLGLGVAVLGNDSFFRLFPGRDPNTVNLGLITLRPGADPAAAARALHAALPGDVQVFTRPQLAAHETAYWMTRTSTGLIFGSGLAVAIVVGIMVLYQTLSTQVSRHLPQFATLKAIGYGDAAVAGIVVTLALLIVAVAFVPAFVAALVVYAVIRAQTLLPVSLTLLRLGMVLGITLAMAAVSAILSLSALRRADPAEIF